MSFFDALNISASGMTADRLEMDVTASNLANAQSTNYTPEEVELASTDTGDSFDEELSTALEQVGGVASGSATPSGVEVTGIVQETDDKQLVYDPTSPEANKDGYVTEPDIQPVTEMTDMISESDQYQANVTAMDTTKDMFSSTLELLK